MTRLWGGRFGAEPADALLAFTESASFDHVLVHDDCAVLAAHARALARADLLGEADVASVARALEAIAEDIGSGAFPLEPGDEDIHTAVERALVERLPTIAPKIRAGLSRNDRVATALRRWLRREGSTVVGAVLDLIAALTDRAADHLETPLPGYTHLQRGQPITLAHHLLAHGFALLRDAGRLTDALTRADASPLGSGALAGSTLGLDLEPAARELGFARVVPNSLDAVAARDFVAEFLAGTAIVGVHCSRLGEEIVLWTSDEFGFARLDDAYATGSSLMPQKKNPDVAELARAKAGRLIGNLTGLLSALKGLPLAYNRDLQEDKEPLFDAVRTMQLLLPALRGMVETMTFDTERMASGLDDGAALATDLAEELVRGGMPFREAHDLVGSVAARAADRGTSLAALRAADVSDLSPALTEDVLGCLDVRTSIERRRAPGPAPAGVRAQLSSVRGEVAAMRETLGAS